MRIRTTETLKKLPSRCYLVDPVTPTNVNIIKKGVEGYWVAKHCETPEDAKAWAERLNAHLNVTPRQIEAMEIGSMFGWDVPGANPDYEASAQA